MKNVIFLFLTATLLWSCASTPKPTLGNLVDGYLVNVDDKGVILQGYDPVSFRNGGAAKGDPALQTRYKGATYYFANAEHKAQFDADPKAYAPEYGGYCAYGVSLGKLAPIEVWTFDTTYQNHNIFQHNQKAINGWKKDIPGNYAKAQEEWSKIQKQYHSKSL